MERIAQKTLGELIDQLITTNLHCWFAQEIVTHETDVAKVAEAAKKAQSMNVRRNALIRAIDDMAGFADITQVKKSYG